MPEEGAVTLRHVIAVTVGLSVLDKTLKRSDSHIYNRWMGAGISDGALSKFDLTETERGDGSAEQLKVERKCFEQQWNFPEVDREIRRGKQNRYSAEVSSLHLIFRHKKLRPEECHIILIATDSAEGVIAARINKRVIAHKLLGCPRETARDWRSEADDGSHESLGRMSVVRVRGLQVKNALLLKEQGMEGLERTIISASERISGGEKILNVTGGFKGVIPIAVSIAWLHGWLPTYLYEETNQLTDLPRPAWVRQEERRPGPATNIVVYVPLEGPDE